ncbi:MAG: hypothetical protein KDI32_15155, partial [Pseudomonadales bacterium]|nr:hypothetical protein [Pseudomonadales bacterium]
MRTRTGLMLTAAACAGVSACWLLLPDAATQPNATGALRTASSGVSSQATPRAAALTNTPAKLIAGNPWDDQAIAPAGANTQLADRAMQSVLERVAYLRRPARAGDVPAVQNLDRMSARVAAYAQSGSDARVALLVRHSGKPDDAEVARVERLGGQVLHRYENFPLMAVSMPANHIGEFAGGTSVNFLDLNGSIQSASASARQTANAPPSGAGTSVPVSSNLGVAVVDSGVATHSDLNVVSHQVFN